MHDHPAVACPECHATLHIQPGRSIFAIPAHRRIKVDTGRLQDYDDPLFASVEIELCPGSYRPCSPTN